MGSAMHRRRLLVLIIPVVAALVLGMLPGHAAADNAVGAGSSIGSALKHPHPIDADVTEFPPTKPVSLSAPIKESIEATERRLAKPIAWPQPGRYVIRSGDKAGAAKALVSTAGAKSVELAKPLASVDLEVLGQEFSRRAGVTGVLYANKGSAAALAARSVELTFDYSGYATAVGGDWASRLTVIALPACALTTPGRPACTKVTALKAVNDIAGKTVSTAFPAGSVPAVLAVTAGSGSSTGDYAATQLSASAAWSGGTSGGDFTWSYPLRVPPTEGGPAPKLSFGYSAQSVDGRTSASNNQVSWVGEGFDLTESYIERKYVSCDQNGYPGKFDLCWKYDNASLVLNGTANELVKATADDATGQSTWRLKKDDGSRVQKLTGAANTDSSGEYWLVTTHDGTQYYFGKHVLPSYPTGTVTNSVFTAPVRGGTCASSFCTRAWRWNLDYVVDPHGNAMTYWYVKEGNNYARDGVASPGTPYVRGGWLQRIDYGQSAGSLNSTASQRIDFAVAERCKTDCALLNGSTKQNWPDVPFDQICDTGSACTNKLAPTFFSRKRLTQVATSVLKDGKYQPVDQWQLGQDFLSTNDGSDGAPMWLREIRHAGTAGTAINVPPVTFDGTNLPNRVDAPDDGLNGLFRYRVNKIITETGAEIDVIYSGRDCKRGDLPASKDSNTRRCYPVKWTPPREVEREDWFQKYVVDSVTTSDKTGNGADMVTNYLYEGGAAWHYEDSALLKPSDRTWSDWRGYGTVTTFSGDPANPGPRSRSTTTYFRGMDGDKQENTTVLKNVDVRDSENNLRPDAVPLAGWPREQITYEGANSTAEVSGAITDYFVHQTAMQTAPNLTLRSNFVGPSSVKSRTARDGGRTAMVRTVVTDYDNTTGLPVKVADGGDAEKVDETCTVTEYARNPSTWITLPSRVVSSSGICDTTSTKPAESRVLSDVQTAYDNTPVGGAPTKGDVTAVFRLKDYVGDDAHYEQIATNVYDSTGRVTSTTDVLGRVTSTSYTPAGTGPLTKTVVTQPQVTVAGGATARLAVTTEYRPEWGLATKSTDANQKLTELDYDALGRLTSVWLPSQLRSESKPANTKYTYVLSQSSASSVRTDQLNADATGYITSYAQFDSLLRPRQTQSPSPQGGRVISESRYDSRGLIRYANEDVWDSAAPAAGLLDIANASVQNQTFNTYDGAGRLILSTFQMSLQPKWSTATRYGGDTVTVEPPTGAAASTTVTDIRGQVTERREFSGSLATGTPDTTRYTFDLAGRMTQVSGAGGVWRYGYDLRGRNVTSSDPDSGTTTSTYDDADRLMSTTDSEHTKLITTMDALDRKTGLYRSDTSSTNQLAEWTYDEPGALGLQSTSTRYTSGKTGPAYRTVIGSRNPLYKPKSVSVIIPSAEGSNLKGTYTSKYGFKADEQTPYTQSSPAGGGLGSEELMFDYNQLGMPTRMRGNATYVNDTVYSALGDMNTLDLGALHDFPIDFSYQNGTRRLERATAGLAIVSDHVYSYDPAGNVLRDQDVVDGDTQCFGYDGHRRLAQAWTPASSECETPPTVGGLGGPAAYWQSWTYTPTGLRNTQVNHTPVGDRTSSYTYNSTQPHTLSKVVDSGAGAGPVQQYSYDARGNTITRPGPSGAQSLSWDAEGKLAKLADGSGSTEYLYDADGTLLVRRGPKETTLFVGDLELTLDQSAGKVLGKREYTFNGQNIAVRSANGTATSDLSWLVTDYHQTSQMAVSAATLSPVKRYAKPFGDPRGPAPSSWPDNHNFLGKPEDKATGLTTVGAREYDPATGRFISLDPLLDLADPQQMLGYEYASNNPVSMSDPSGLMNSKEPDSGGSSGDPWSPPPGTDHGDTHEGGAGLTRSHDDDVDYYTEPTHRVLGHMSLVASSSHRYGEAWDETVPLWRKKMGQRAAIPTTACINNDYDHCDPSEILDLYNFMKIMCQRPGIACGGYQGSGVSVAMAAAGGGALFGGGAGAGGKLGSGGSIDRTQYSTRISFQKQERHILGGKNYDNGGYFKRHEDAQEVLDAFHSGQGQVLGLAKTSGNVVIRVPSVTGYNNNVRQNYFNQPTDTFMIKGTKSVSVVPINPNGVPLK